MVPKFLLLVFEAILLAIQSTSRNTTPVNVPGSIQGCQSLDGDS